MEDKLLEKILNFVLNNMGNAECMHLESYLNSRAKFYTDREKLVEALSWYADKNNCDNADFAHVEIGEDGEEIADGGFRARTTLKELGEME